jgi:hypothetical protein
MDLRGMQLGVIGWIDLSQENKQLTDLGSKKFEEIL